MNPLFNLLLAVVGLFLVVGVVGLPALIQWPIPASAQTNPIAYILRGTGPAHTRGGYR